MDTGRVEEDPWHTPLLVIFLVAVATNSLYMVSRWVNFFHAVKSTRFFTNKPSPEKGGAVPSGQEPHVTIQICTYNEGKLVEETIARACSIDWPWDKLSIHVLDDSSDPTSCQIVASVVANWSERGINISRRTRPSRIGYKAGNLRHHFDAVTSQYVAYFDADHRMEQDFLRRTIPFFFDDAGNSKDEIGLVQTPWGYYNEGRNFLTRCDALALDIHHVIEQTGRAAAYGCFGFNGTGGVWRKTAIKDGGGWSWDSVTEDLALSYRSYLKGYRFVYVRDMPQLLEVPGDISAHIQQKHRWTKGFWQVFRQSYWNIFFSPKIGTALKVEAFCHLTSSIQYTALLFAMFLYPFLVLHGIDGPYLKAAAIFPTMEPMTSAVVACYAKHPGPKCQYGCFLSRTGRLAMILPFISLNAAMSLFRTKALLEGLFSSDATFLTTPKDGFSTNQYMMKSAFKSTNLVKRNALDDIVAISGFVLGVNQILFIMAYDINYPWRGIFEVPFRLLNAMLGCSLLWVNCCFLIEKYMGRGVHWIGRYARLLHRLLLVQNGQKERRAIPISWWNIYFLAKLYLHFRGALNVSVAWNILLLIWVRVPVSIIRGSKMVREKTSLVKEAFDTVIGLLVLWRDTWFPSLLVVIKFWLDPLTRPTGQAFGMYVQDNLSFPEITVIILIGWSVLTARKHRLRTTSVVVALFCLVSVSNTVRSLRVPTDSKAITTHLQTFHKLESLKRVKYPDTVGAPVDIVLLHVCSLSWDDLDVVDEKENQIFSRFNYLFDDFNTVTSYSGPSMVRLLRSNCGQQIHGDLYNEAPSECYLMDSLRLLGYEVSTLLDHDGTFDDFKKGVSDLGHGASPMQTEGLSVEQILFDGSELSNPEAVFDSWLTTLSSSGVERAAVYFNTMTLHSGSHWEGETDWWKNRDPVKEYADRVDRVFRLIDAICNKIETSGRSAAILVVPEHGAAVRGTHIQNSNLRDIPLPRIVKSFFGVRFVGPAFPERPASTVHVDGSVSYIAVAEVIAATVTDPAQAAGNLTHNTLTETRFVAENSRGTVVHLDGNYMLQTKDGSWMALDSPDLAPADRQQSHA